MTTTKSKRCSVTTARQRLEAGGLKKMEGSSNRSFEIWIRKDGEPEMVPYADESCQEVLKDAVDEILIGTPY
jgi:hypothetical protein